MMENSDDLDDLGDSKRYLEEVMGIVEDEEFNRERRRKLNEAKEADLEEDDFDYESAGYAEPWCCTKILFFLILSVFLTVSLLVMTNYKEDDSLGLRKVIQEDSLGVASLALAINSIEFKMKELNNLPMLLLNGASSIVAETKPILTKLWSWFEQKWLTPSVRVYKDNFPFLKPKDKVKQAPMKETPTPNAKQQQEEPQPYVAYKKEQRKPENDPLGNSEKEDEKIKDFKRLQEKRRLSSTDIGREGEVRTKKERQPKNKR
eukprot:TRINITY_DN8558_c0_g1_i1.p1 TRINITY_DN8558_c0_g1~~TRINITY_DN8558_c0_g1_i1.p1  ORF type:complete len:261 (-),score=71.96 TRINITY_DN8558_c0_g1_i1:128-910(-)